MTPGEKRAGREMAMQLLCHWDVQSLDPRAELEGVALERQASSASRRFARILLDQILTHRSAIDSAIGEGSPNWSLGRMSLVERNILRVAAAELLAAPTPVKAVIDEAIEVAKTFGGAESPRFINGVLDAMLRRLRNDMADPGVGSDAATGPITQKDVDGTL